MSRPAKAEMDQDAPVVLLRIDYSPFEDSTDGRSLGTRLKIEAEVYGVTDLMLARRSVGRLLVGGSP